MNDILHPFAQRGVSLLPSRWQARVAQARDMYGALSEAALLHGFRRQAGLPAPGPAMAGWCSAIASVIFGQIVSGACCAGSWLQFMARLHDIVAFHAPDALHIALYLPAEIAWDHDGQTILLTQATVYPDAETITQRLAMDRPARFTLALRLPGWATSHEIAVNGAPAAARIEAGWLQLCRDWQPDDTVSLTLPMALRLVPVDPLHPARAAVLFGPTVLAQDEACCRRPFNLAPGTAPETRLICEGSRFRITNTVPERHARYLVPFHTLPANWPYWIYFDLHERPLH